MLQKMFDLNSPVASKEKTFQSVDEQQPTADDRAWLYYKLTLWTFGSGELKRWPKNSTAHVQYIVFKRGLF